MRAAGSTSRPIGRTGTTEMSEVTYYVALPFVAADDGIAAGEAVECFNPNGAVMKAEAPRNALHRFAAQPVGFV